MIKLIYPHVYLFAYHIISGKSNFEDSGQPKITYFQEGFCSERCIGDSQTLLLACSVADEINPPEKHSLNTLKDKLLAKKQESSFLADLGKTWVITGYLPRLSYEVGDNIRENIRYEIAEKAYENLGFKSFPNNIKSGQFMGGTVFEVSREHKNWENLDADDNHILIILYPDLKTMKGIANFYEDWRYLFYYRNKIIWACSNARKIKPLLKKNFSPMDKPKNQNIKLSKYTLDQLKDFLEENYRDLVLYAESISFLEVQKQTIQTNLYNFQQRLKSIKNKAEEVAYDSTDLDIINRFSEIVEHKYLAQVEQDYLAFSPGLKLKDKWIDTIRGIVEIRQVQLSEQKEERDQKFQNNIAVVGVGMGAAAVIASATANYIEPIREYPLVKQYFTHWKPKLADMLLTTTLSIIAGFAFALLTILIIWLRESCQLLVKGVETHFIAEGRRQRLGERRKKK